MCFIKKTQFKFKNYLKMKQSFISGLFILAMAVLAVSCASDAADGKAALSTATDAMAKPMADNAPTSAPGAEAAVPTGPTTVMDFDATEFDFGTVDEGEKVSHTYSFKNTGDEPLILSNAKGSCGCTVPKWPKEPIPPGEDGEIIVEFNSKNKKGKRNQKVTITANTNPPQTFIYLKGEVNPAEAAN